MAMNPLPPQAYTKDTLLKAYHWLQTQTPSIKEMATTPDVLVSLFLKASRDGESALERPSIQNFKMELKNLAGMIGDLEEKKSPMQIVQPQAQMHQQQQVTSSTQVKIEHTKFAQAHNLDAQTMESLRHAQELLNLSSEAEAERVLIQLGIMKLKAMLQDF